MQRIVCKRTKRPIKETAAVALLSAIMCVCAMINIPLAVPITLQTLALSFGLFFLGGKLTLLSTLIYVSIGALGVPVFSGFSGGVARLFDATGGFIIGIPLAALLYWCFEFFFKAKGRAKLPIAIAAHAMLYLSGSLWYAFVYLGGERGAFLTALLVAVLPFIIPDLVKLVLAYLIAKRIPKLDF